MSGLEFVAMGPLFQILEPGKFQLPSEKNKEGIILGPSTGNWAMIRYILG